METPEQARHREMEEENAMLKKELQHFKDKEKQTKAAAGERVTTERAASMRSISRSEKFFRIVLIFLSVSAFVSLGLLFGFSNGEFSIIGTIAYIVISTMIGLGIYYSHFD